MKTKIKSISLVALFLLAVVSCDDESNSATVMSNDEAADQIALSLSESSSGLTVTVDETVSVTETAVEANAGARTTACGYSENFNFSTSNPQGSLITFSYTFAYSYALSCGTDSLPASMQTLVTYSGEFDAPRLASAHTGDGVLTVTALDNTSTAYSIDGSYSRDGSFESKVNNLSAGSNTLVMAIDDLVVNKTTKRIESGSASITLTGTVTGKGDYSFTASIIFNGDGTATATLNGDIYSVDLSTGIVTKL
jgi:hypothetical protein